MKRGELHMTQINTKYKYQVQTSDSQSVHHLLRPQIKCKYEQLKVSTSVHSIFVHPTQNQK